MKSKFKKIIYLIISCFIPILILFILYMPETASIRLTWIDYLYYIANVKQAKAPDNIVIVAIDEPSFQEIKVHWPWPRSYHAKIIDNLKESGALSIAFDIMFVEKSKDPKEDEMLAMSAKRAGNVILGTFLSKIVRKDYNESAWIKPFDLLYNSAKDIGVVSFHPDSDGIMRHGLVWFQDDKGQDMPSLAFAAAKVSGFASSISPDDDQNMFWIDFAGISGTIPTVSYYQVLENKLPKDFFKDKIVFVGLSSDTAVEIQGAVDAFPTPFFHFSQKMMFGVEIHANAAHTIINGSKLREFYPQWLWIFLLFIVFIPWFVRKRPIVLSIITFSLIVILGSISAYMFLYQSLIFDILPLMASVFGCGVWSGVTEYRSSIKEKKQLRGAFDRYVAPDVVKAVLKNPEMLRLGGQKKELSVLFSDIRGFTTLSEGLQPEQLVSLLNNYLTCMTDKVFNNRGTLDKYIGDALMAIFGAPLAYKDHADCACKTAIEMVNSLDALASEWAQLHLPPLRIGIGINTGPMVVGNMGSHKRFDYTVMGDEVNLASRLEGINKTYSTTVIISESTKKSISNKFICRELDLVKVKGKNKPIKIYELIGEDSIDQISEFIIQSFAKGLEAYRNQSWYEARKNFNSILKVKPDDGPANVFMQRCDLFKSNPPEANWDGVWTMTTK